MARYAKDEKWIIARDSLCMTFREVAAIHGVSLCMIHKNLRSQLFSFFLPSELYDRNGNVKDIKELRKIFHQYRTAIYKQENQKLSKKKTVPEERVRKGIKHLSRYKTYDEIAQSYNYLGTKNFQGDDWTAEDIKQICEA